MLSVFLNNLQIFNFKTFKIFRVQTSGKIYIIVFFSQRGIKLCCFKVTAAAYNSAHAFFRQASQKFIPVGVKLSVIIMTVSIKIFYTYYI